MTVNDLERHKKAVHNLKPRVGSSVGYVCSVCQTTGIGDAKWWPRLDNFKAHILRKHKVADMQSVIESSKRLMRPEDTLTVMTMVSDTPSTSSSGLSQGYPLPLSGNYSAAVDEREPYIAALRQHHMMSQNQPHAQLPLPHPHPPPSSNHVPLHSHLETSPQSQHLQLPPTQVRMSPHSQQLPPPSQLQTPQHSHAQLPPLRPTSSAPSGATSGISLPSVSAPPQSNNQHATLSPQPPHAQTETHPPTQQTQQDSQPDTEMQG
ncbi:hypothetical protein K431DRAFT_44607 [Polychaeton citri CBS 116435]|uniref:Uncharacterized protein n=1 Tax=Polychaeton citri CBS 116435 TaxID=1314669 RepID=A0A9P4QA93_9PEZI|nr:hypothetical protein K431DRAFT_44607 [Polychaeton citri CBS 116435]